MLNVFIVVLLTAADAAACERQRKIFLGYTKPRNFDTGILVRVVEKFFGTMLIYNLGEKKVYKAPYYYLVSGLT